jgi:hypothetical protein
MPHAVSYASSHVVVDSAEHFEPAETARYKLADTRAVMSEAQLSFVVDSRSVVGAKAAHPLSRQRYGRRDIARATPMGETLLFVGAKLGEHAEIFERRSVALGLGSRRHVFQ